MDNEISNILRQHGLKATETRTKILEQFYLKNHALSHQDLESTISDLDRVTIYRTLNTFEEKGITHKIMSASGVATFALCKSQCTVHKHHDNHFHFQCYTCEKTYCLPETLQQDIKLPKGFVMQDVRLIVRGICSDCA